MDKCPNCGHTISTSNYEGSKLYGDVCPVCGEDLTYRKFADTSEDNSNKSLKERVLDFFRKLYKKSSKDRQGVGVILNAATRFESELARLSKGCGTKTRLLNGHEAAGVEPKRFC